MSFGIFRYTATYCLGFLVASGCGGEAAETDSSPSEESRAASPSEPDIKGESDELVNGQSGDLGTENVLPQEVCPWDAMPSPSVPVPGPQIEREEPTEEEKQRYIDDAIAIVAELEDATVDLYWLTQAQYFAEVYQGREGHIEADSTVHDRLHIRVALRDKETTLGKCAAPAYVPARITLRSDNGSIMDQEADVGFDVNPETGIFSVSYFDLLVPNPYGLQSMFLNYDPRFGWTGVVSPTPMDMPDESEDGDVVYDGLAYGRFPTACGGWEQVPVDDGAGFVAAAAVAERIWGMPSIELSFPEIGSTSFRLELNDLSETTCLNDGWLSFAADVSMVHESGARLDHPNVITMMGCTKRILGEPVSWSDDCVTVRLDVSSGLDDGEPMARALLADLGLEGHPNLDQSAVVCTVLVNTTATAIRDGSASCYLRLGDDIYDINVAL